MQLTPRDRKLIEDIALHHVINSEQIVKLGYFTSSSRANRRLFTLAKAGCLERVRINASCEPRRALYRAAKQPKATIDPRVLALLVSRRLSALQLDHSLTVVDVRIKLKTLGMDGWLAEPQSRHRYVISQGNSRSAEDVRPDGLAWFGNRCLFVEVDRGHVSLPRISAKLKSYATYRRCGMFAETYGAVDPAVLVVTTGQLRKRHVAGLVSPGFPLPVFIHTTAHFVGCTELSEVAR